MLKQAAARKQIELMDEIDPLPDCVSGDEKVTKPDR